MNGPTIARDQDGNLTAYLMPEPHGPGGWKVEVYDADDPSRQQPPFMVLRGADLSEREDVHRKPVRLLEVKVLGRSDWVDATQDTVYTAVLTTVVLSREFHRSRQVLHAYMGEPALADYRTYDAAAALPFMPRLADGRRVDRGSLPDTARMVTMVITLENGS